MSDQWERIRTIVIARSNEEDSKDPRRDRSRGNAASGRQFKRIYRWSSGNKTSVSLDNAGR